MFQFFHRNDSIKLWRCTCFSSTAGTVKSSWSTSPEQYQANQTSTYQSSIFYPHSSHHWAPKREH